MLDNEKIITLFPKTIFKTNLKIDNSSIKKTIKKIKFIKGDHINNSSSSSCDRNVLNNIKQLTMIKSIIEEKFNHFKNYYMGWTNNRFFISTSWITKSQPNQECQMHRHKNCLYSGVYYVDVPKNSGDILFTNINTPDFYIIPKTFNQYNSSNATIKTQEGDLIFFPSNLHHKITLNNSKKERYSIAFNFFPIGNLGKGDSQITLTNEI